METACTHKNGSNIIQIRYYNWRFKESFHSRIYFELYVLFYRIFRSKRVTRINRNGFRIIELDFSDIKHPLSNLYPPEDKQ